MHTYCTLHIDCCLCVQIPSPKGNGRFRMFWISDRTWRKPCPACEGLSSARGEWEPAHVYGMKNHSLTNSRTAAFQWIVNLGESSTMLFGNNLHAHVSQQSTDRNKALYYTQTITFSTTIQPPTSFGRVATSVVLTPGCHIHKYTMKHFPSMNNNKHTQKSAGLQALHSQIYSNTLLDFDIFWENEWCLSM